MSVEKTRNRKTGTRAVKTSQIKRTKKAVLDSTVVLLGDVGYRQLTVELISQHSGVARSTIYRHWSNVAALTIEAFDEALGPNPTPPDLGDVRSDLIFAHRRLADLLRRSIWGSVLPSLIEATHNDPKFEGLLAKFVAQRQKNLLYLVQRGIDRGELNKSTKPDWIIDSLSGLLYFRLLISGKPTGTKGMVEWAVDSALSQHLTRR